MTLRFEPPKTVAKYALFTVNVGNGKTTFKSYDDLGSAKNAYHNKYNVDAKILESVDGQWYVLFDIPNGTRYENLPWVKKVQRRFGYSYNEHSYPTSVPMTREEYAEWRLKVERERVSQ